jgi:uncharacterized membrane protein
MKHITFVSVLAVAAGGAAQGVRYEVTDLTKQYGLTQGQAVIDINSQGVMIGGGDGYAFTIEDGKYSVLERPQGAVDYFTLAINEQGVILGSASFAGGPDRSVVWVNGKPTILDLSPAVGFQSSGPLYRLNELGDYVGTDYGPQKPIRWSEKGGLHYLDVPVGAVGGASGVNDSGTVTGGLLTGGIVRATRWLSGVYQDLHPGGYAESRALGIAQNGDIGGEVETSSAFHAAFWRNGTEFIDIGALTPTDFTFFGDLNEAEQMVGQASFNGRFASYLWEKGILYNLQNLVDPNLSWELINAMAINDSGQIIAGGRRKGPEGANLLLSPVPETQTILLLTLGVVWLLARRWR